MIIVDKPKLKFLLAGREVQVTSPRTPSREYRVSHHYSIGTRHNHAICRVLIVRADLGELEWVLTVRLSEAEPARLLGKTGGYTSDPGRAMDDDPGEAVDSATQTRLTDLGTIRWQEARLEQQQRMMARSLAVRLKDAQRRGDPDELRRICREIGRLEKQMRRDQAA